MKAQRNEEILKLVRRDGAASVRQLADRLSVSEMTVRRDVHKLCASGVLRVMNGVVFFAAQQSEESYYSLSQQKVINAPEKDAIARAAAAMIEPGDTVILDCGTTAEAMLRHIQPGMDITVICSSLNVLVEMQKKDITNLVFSGGFYHHETQTFVSPEALKMLGNIRATKAFITAAGVSCELGLTCVHQYETELKQLALTNAAKRILIADASKFGKVSTAYFGELRKLTAVITDDRLDQDWRQTLQSQNIELTCVSTYGRGGHPVPPAEKIRRNENGSE